MTREERLAQRKAHLQQRLAVQRKHLAQVNARQKQAAHQAQQKRYLAVGKLVHDAGLLVLDDVTLAGLFRTLTMLLAVPNPVAVLDTLLTEIRCPGSVYSDTSAVLGEVAPAGPVGQAAR